jgi:hypothetical protein
MTTSRLIAIGFICFVSAIAWFILGTSVTGRSGAFDSQLTSEVSRLWGGVQRQAAPSVAVYRPVAVTETVQEPQPSGAPITRKIKKSITQSTPIPLDSSRVSVDCGFSIGRKDSSGTTRIPSLLKASTSSTILMRSRASSWRASSSRLRMHRTTSSRFG